MVSLFILRFKRFANLSNILCCMVRVCLSRLLYRINFFICDIVIDIWEPCKISLPVLPVSLVDHPYNLKKFTLSRL